MTKRGKVGNLNRALSVVLTIAGVKMAVVLMAFVLFGLGA